MRAGLSMPLSAAIFATVQLYLFADAQGGITFFYRVKNVVLVFGAARHPASGFQSFAGCRPCRLRYRPSASASPDDRYISG